MDTFATASPRGQCLVAQAGVGTYHKQREPS